MRRCGGDRDRLGSRGPLRRTDGFEIMLYKAGTFVDDASVSSPSSSWITQG